MLILKPIWSDSLLSHIAGSRSLEKNLFYDCQLLAFFLSQDCLYIWCHLVNIFASFHLDIHYFLGFIHSFLASGDFCCLLIAFANSFGPESVPT